MERLTVLAGLFICFASLIYPADSTCVLESDFGFTINCAFKKSGLFRVRNLGGIKAHVGLGFSVGDELGFGQSLTNQDPSRRRSVSIKNGLPPNAIAEPAVASAKQEKRGKQNRLIVRQPSQNQSPPPMPTAAATANLAAVKAAMANLQRRVQSPTTMQPIIVPSAPAMESITRTDAIPKVTIAKPLPMGVPPFKPLPPKENAQVNVLPIATTRRTPQIPQAKGPGLAYTSENNARFTQDQVSKMVSQMTAAQARISNRPQTPPPIVDNYRLSYTTPHIPAFQALPNSNNQFVPMPVAATPVRVSGLSIIPAPVFNTAPKATTASFIQNPVIRKQPAPQSYPSSNFVDPDPHGVNDLAGQIYPVYPTKKLDDYNSISGYGDESQYNFSKDDLNAKISQIAQAGNISMEAVEAAILLRQQQLLNQYANIPLPTSTTTTTTTTTEPLLPFQPEPPVAYQPVTPKQQKRYPMASGSAKVMNAPREYYPIGYEKNFDDQFVSKVELPETSFYCGDQKYFPGLYGDENLGCMVFHVCALTDDGLVMKSFLCPESTLFDQTILKCNWWFYVDCKQSKQLYDTNIPVSKSYQLMKALTFFSSYNKENADDGGRTQNPEDMEGVKEAIAIFENQDSQKHSQGQQADNMEIITAQPIISSRTNVVRVSSSKYNGTTNHRMDRGYTKNATATNLNSSKTAATKPKVSRISIASTNDSKNSNFDDTETSGSERVETVVKRTESSKSESTEFGSSEGSSSKERIIRRRKNLYALRGNKIITSTAKPKRSSTTEAPNVEPTVTPKIDVTTEIIEKPVTTEIIEKPATIKVIEKPVTTEPEEQILKVIPKIKVRADTKYIPKYEPQIKLEKNETLNELNNITDSKTPDTKDVKSYKPTKEISMVNNEKVQIVRPTPISELVGQYQTPTATITALDQAILGPVEDNVPKLSIAQPTAATLQASYTIGDSTSDQETT